MKKKNKKNKRKHTGITYQPDSKHWLHLLLPGNGNRLISFENLFTGWREGPFPFRDARNCRATVWFKVFLHTHLRDPIKYITLIDVHYSAVPKKMWERTFCRIYHTWDWLIPIFYPVLFWNNAVFVGFSWLNGYLEFIDWSGPPPIILLRVELLGLLPMYCWDDCYFSKTLMKLEIKCLEFGMINNCALLFGNLKRALFQNVWPVHIDTNDWRRHCLTVNTLTFEGKHHYQRGI